MISAPYSLHDIPEATDTLIIVTVFGTIALLTTIFRLLGRRLRSIDVGWDDWFVVMGLFWAILEVVIMWVSVIYGAVGRNYAEINPTDALVTLKIIIPFEIFYGFGMSSAKLSILVLYLRIFGTDKGMRKKVLILAGLINVWTVMVILETFFICRPFAYNWDPTIKGGSCGNRNAMFVFTGASNMVTDIMVMLLPVSTIWRLQMNAFRKVGVLAVFCLGVFITIVSVLRLKSLLEVDFTNPTKTFPQGMMWTALEPTLAVINANLPVLRPLVATMFPSIFRSTNKGTGATTEGSHFKRLDDGTYPLTHVSRVENQITTSKRGSGDHGLTVKYGEQTSTRSLSGESDDLKEINNGIHIRTEWQVDNRGT